MTHKHLPDGWRWAQLRNICHFEKGKYATMQTDPGDYPFVVTAAERSTANVFQIDGEAVCVPLISSTGHGDAAMHRVHYETGKFAVANLLVALIPKCQEECSAEYLYWLFMAKKDEYFVPLMTGTANVSLRIEDIQLTHIPLPPIGEQHRIAEILRDADANIARVEAQIEAAQAVKRGVMQRLFTYGLAGEGATTKQTRIGDIPEHWLLSEVGKEFDVTSGFTFGPDRHPRQNKYKYLRVANVQREFIDLSVLAELEATPDEIAAKTLLEGDILAVEGHANPLEIGRCALVTRDAAGLTFQNHLFRLRSRMVKPQYAIAWLNSSWMGAYWEKHSRTSSGLHTINRSMLNEVPFPVPTEEEQCEIAAILSAHNATIHNLQAEAASLREVKRGLMQKLLSGQVRV